MLDKVHFGPERVLERLQTFAESKGPVKERGD